MTKLPVHSRVAELRSEEGRPRDCRIRRASGAVPPRTLAYHDACARLERVKRLPVCPILTRLETMFLQLPRVLETAFWHYDDKLFRRTCLLVDECVSWLGRLHRTARAWYNAIPDPQLSAHEKVRILREYDAQLDRFDELNGELEFVRQSPWRARPLARREALR